MPAQVQRDRAIFDRKFLQLILPLFRLSPKPGTAGRNLTTEIRANSDTEARQLAEAQYPAYRVEAISRIG